MFAMESAASFQSPDTVLRGPAIHARWHRNPRHRLARNIAAPPDRDPTTAIEPGSTRKAGGFVVGGAPPSDFQSAHGTGTILPRQLSPAGSIAGPSTGNCGDRSECRSRAAASPATAPMQQWRRWVRKLRNDLTREHDVPFCNARRTRCSMSSGVSPFWRATTRKPVRIPAGSAA